MIKRKYGDRAGWSRIINRSFIQARFDEEHFKGYATLLGINQVTAPLYVEYGNQSLCIVNEGYSWLQHFPENKQYSVTTMFDREGNIIQWYIDICRCNGLDGDRPWIDDLFLDLVVLPSGKIILKDEDELEHALMSGIINQNSYHLARSEAASIVRLIEADEFPLLTLSKEHKERLIGMMGSNH
jgi:uncharacterized protein